MRYQPLGEYSPDGLLTEFSAVYCGVAVIAAVAAQNSHAQLFMPASTGVNAQLLECWISLATAGDIIISHYSTALTTDDGAGVCTHVGSAAGQAHVRHQTNAGLLGTARGRFSIPAATAVMIPGRRIYQASENTGITIEAVTVNIAMNVTFYWYEP